MGLHLSISTRQTPNPSGPYQIRRDIRQEGDKDKETQGDLMIQYVWDQHDDAIIDVKHDDSNTNSYKYDPMDVLLVW